MIFVTVGSQLPFDRMTAAAERWAAAAGRADDVFYQIGDGRPPASGTWVRTMPPDEYRARFAEAELVVGHAGTGTWMMAAELGRKLILFPRRFRGHREHRNDHQLAMCERVAPAGVVTVALTEEDLRSRLADPASVRVPALHSTTSGRLVASARAWLAETFRAARAAGARGYGEDGPPRLLAVSSGGGHWHELLCLRPAFADCERHFAGVGPGWAASVAPDPYHPIDDANFNHPLRCWRVYRQLRALMERLRPHLVVSAGAAPGGLAMLAARRRGVRTLWMDSAANTQVLSRSGRLARRVATAVWTQWPELARAGGPEYHGGLLL